MSINGIRLTFAGGWSSVGEFPHSRKFPFKDILKEKRSFKEGKRTKKGIKEI
jgi:hypothetical protein